MKTLVKLPVMALTLAVISLAGSALAQSESHDAGAALLTTLSHDAGALGQISHDAGALALNTHSHDGGTVTALNTHSHDGGAITAENASHDAGSIVAQISPETPSATPPATPSGGGDAAKLPVRAEHPLKFVESSTSPFSRTALVVVVLLGIAALWIKRRASLARSPEQGPAMRVTQRVNVALRSDVVLLEVEGTRLVVGVTPHSMQVLTTLDAHPHETPSLIDDAPRAQPRGTRRSEVVREQDAARIAALFRSTRRPPAAEVPNVSNGSGPSTVVPPSLDDAEEQVRGLRMLQGGVS